MSARTLELAIGNHGADNLPEGFMIDEPYDRLGHDFQIPPVFASQAEWIKGYLEPLHY